MMNRVRSWVRKWLGLERAYNHFAWGCDDNTYQKMLNDWTHKKIQIEAAEREIERREHEAAVVQLISKAAARQKKRSA